MNLELAKRAVTCKRWKWMPGMLIEADGHFDRVCIAWEDGMLECRDNEMIGDQIADVLPDLDDPATLGCLLALVREAWGGHSAGFQIGPSSDHEWEMWLQHRTEERRWFYGKTEAAALVAALEAAP
jgi:hypothetical protein